jgi:hypothetical protein
MAKKQLDALGVKYEMSTTDKVRPFKVIYQPINKSDEFYDKFEDIVDLFNLKGVVKSSMNENFPGPGEIVDAKYLNNAMLDYFNRMNIKLLINTKTEKGIKGGVGTMYGDLVFNGDSINKKDIVRVKILEDVAINEEVGNYMFFQNLKQIKENVERILALNENEVDTILSDGHAWAIDHVTTSKDDMEEVTNFLIHNIENPTV